MSTPTYEITDVEDGSKWVYEILGGPTGTVGKFSSVAFPIDREVFVLVKKHEDLPSIEIRYFIYKEGELSAESTLGARLTRLGWDHLVLLADELLAIMNNVEDHWEETMEQKVFFVDIRGDESVMAWPLGGLTIDTRNSKNLPERSVYLTAENFCKLVGEEMRLKINQAFDTLDYE